MSVLITPAHDVMNMAGDGEEAASYSTDADGSVAVAGQKLLQVPEGFRRNHPRHPLDF